MIHFFQRFKTPDQYIKSGVKYCEPMTATEVIGGEDTELLNNSNYYVEEKFDGTRATLHFYSASIKEREYLNSLTDKMLVFVLDFVLNYLLTPDNKEEVLNYCDTPSYSISELSRYLNDLALAYFTENREVSLYLKGKRVSITYNPCGLNCCYEGATSLTTYLWVSISQAIEELIDIGGFYPSDTYTRCFSRRISKKTNWFSENTDSVPQLRDLQFPPELNGTVIDGEIFIPNKPFKDASGTLNCKWDEAIKRQQEKGFLVLHAFDILYYKGVKVENMPLHRRKYYLDKVCKCLSSEYVQIVPYYPANKVPMKQLPQPLLDKLFKEKDSYPELYDFCNGGHLKSPFTNAKVYYQSIVLRGGEGVILKDVSGRYYHKRGREYQKVKRFLTRDVVIIGFEKPTKEYKGKFPDDHWDYWVNKEGNKVSRTIGKEHSASELLNMGFEPVTKFYYEDWVGEIRFGVVITPEEENNLPKNKKFNIVEVPIDDKCVRVLEVGQCSGFDEEMRYLLTCNAYDMDGETPICLDPEQIEALGLKTLNWVGTVIEVKAQEVFKDTGKLRHPRFMRIREDKSGLQCTYSDHIG